MLPVGITLARAVICFKSFKKNKSRRERQHPTAVRQNHMQQTAQRDVLFVSPVREDQAALRRIVGADYPIPAATCRQAFWQLGRNRFDVVLCNTDLPDGSWIDILDHIAASEDPPLLIVTSRLADDHLWSKVLNFGGFDVLSTPFHESEVCHVLETARFRRQCRTGPHLAAGA